MIVSRKLSGRLKKRLGPHEWNSKEKRNIKRNQSQKHLDIKWWIFLFIFIFLSKSKYEWRTLFVLCFWLKALGLLAESPHNKLYLSRVSWCSISSFSKTFTIRLDWKLILKSKHKQVDLSTFLTHVFFFSILRICLW